LTPEASAWLAQEGFDPVYGARPLRRAVQRHLENALSHGILSGEFQEGDHVQVDAANGRLTLGKSVAAAQSA
jgi:ATP-dependent Clp protease ATP-binding subunit ClpA